MITKLRQRILETYGTGNQNRLADLLHIDRADMSRYATGIKPIAGHHLIALCQALHCTPHDLTGYVETERVGS